MKRKIEELKCQNVGFNLARFTTLHIIIVEKLPITKYKTTKETPIIYLIMALLKIILF